MSGYAQSDNNDLIEEHVDKLQKFGCDLTLENDEDIFGFGVSLPPTLDGCGEIASVVHDSGYLSGYSTGN